MKTSPDTPPIFECVLRPHRSAKTQSASIVVGAVAFVLFTVGVAFLLAGAWPVLFFFGLEVALLGTALTINHRLARACEMIALTETELTVRRIDHRGRRECWSFQPYWLKVRHDFADAPVELSSHGRSVAVGGFLAPGERRKLAEALRSALAPLSGIAEIAAWSLRGQAALPATTCAQVSPSTSRME